MNKTDFKGAIFDLDGTLLDSMWVWHQVDLEFFARRRIDMPADYPAQVKNMHFPSAAVYTKERFQLTDSVEEITAEWRELCFDAYENRIRLKEGAEQYLRRLIADGVKIAYATASEEPLCRAALGANGVWELFEARTYVSETAGSKAEPDVYLLAAERMGLSPRECMVFEDILQGVRGAKKGGFRVCGVYDSSNEREADELRRTADIYIKSFYELLK